MGAKRGRGLGSQSQKPTTRLGAAKFTAAFSYPRGRIEHMGGETAKRETGERRWRDAVRARHHTYEDDLIVASEVAVN
jgi:hypothetical protein